jgi:hypothetical protein
MQRTSYVGLVLGLALQSAAAQDKQPVVRKSGEVRNCS